MALHEYQKQKYKKMMIIAVLVVLPIAGFFVGVAYEKQTGNKTAATSQNRPGGRFGQNMRNRAIGTAEAITDTHITIASRLGTDKTYTITSSTTFKNGTSDAKAGDIKVGNTVLVTLDPNDTSKAVGVTINPTFNRPPTDENSDPPTLLQ
jgi:hypothetical protein